MNQTKTKRRPALTKQVFRVLQTCFNEADAGGFIAHIETSPEIFTDEAIQAASEWIYEWSDKWKS